ncbi:copper resistance CopC family protein [Paenibacillus mesophilus]|uniref:copper resistance CopC family protein n=1 Tax=Paenibacillus mesophilus TaxID=2582849 RepID=UPI0013050D50|nr:copper resistance CopC family protein [Paenibacillus mesophilus]
MKRKTLITLLVSIMLLLTPIAAYAHTGLQSSSPARGETVDKPLNEIRMEFNTDIESLSTFEIRNGNNETLKLSGIGVNKSTMSGKLDSALPNGEYTVTWKIIGRDGHPVENKFSFAVKLAQQETPKPAESVSAGVNANKQQEAAPVPAANSNDGSSTLIATSILVAAAVLIVLFRVLRRKK